jgi:aconitate hydratase
MDTANPFDNIKKDLTVGDKTYQYYSLKDLNDQRLEKLPFSIRVLLESGIRNCDEFSVKSQDIETILNWKETSANKVEIPFMPARVIL